VLRSHDRPGAEQELRALLTVYQVLRMAMADATESVPGTNPDRACFTSALETARDQLIAAQGITGTSDAGDICRIGRAVLASLLPGRRPRVQRLQGQMRHLPVPQPRRRPPAAIHHHRSRRHHRARTGARLGWPGLRCGVPYGYVCSPAYSRRHAPLAPRGPRCVRKSAASLASYPQSCPCGRRQALPRLRSPTVTSTRKNSRPRVINIAHIALVNTQGEIATVISVCRHLFLAQTQLCSESRRSEKAGGPTPFVGQFQRSLVPSRARFRGCVWLGHGGRASPQAMSESARESCISPNSR